MTTAKLPRDILRREYVFFLLATGAVCLHFLDDNVLQPAAGTSPGDHLASGLVPLAVLAAAAALYPRLRAGVQAATAMTSGAIAITVGVPGASQRRQSPTAIPTSFADHRRRLVSSFGRSSGSSSSRSASPTSTPTPERAR